MIVTRTFKDWWQWSWRLGKDRPQGYLDNLVFRPRIPDFKPSTYYQDAICNALANITDTDSDIVLFLSGGVDSESILQTACQNFDPQLIRPVFLKFDHNLNDHEYYFVKHIAKKLDVEVTLINIDIESWLYTSGSDYSWRHCNSELHFQHPALAMLTWLRHEVQKLWGDVTVIQGNGDIPLYGFANPNWPMSRTWSVNYCLQANFGTLKYFYDNWPQDIPYFYTYTPQLVHSIMSEFHRLQLLDHSVWYTSECRSQVFSDNFHEQVIRKKHFGLEKVYKTYSDIPRYHTYQAQHPEPYVYQDYDEYYKLLQSHTTQ